LCGGTKAVEVHHLIPFSIAPDLELDPHNLITLCERKKYGINCHLLVGHLGNYRRFNSSWMKSTMLCMMCGPPSKFTEQSDNARIKSTCRSPDTFRS